VYDSNNVLVAFEDDSCLLCASLTFTPLPTSAAGTVGSFRLEQGCYAYKSCSGQYSITNAQLLSTAPTSSPVVVTSKPTQTSSPTQTLSPTPSSSSFYCPTYSTTYSSSSVPVCTFWACAGQSITISGCSSDGGSCSGDTKVLLYNSFGNLVANNDDYCGRCSKISYTTSGSCQKYSISESKFSKNANYVVITNCILACYSGSCSGSYLVTGATSQYSPTLTPTIAIPTTQPSTRFPTTSLQPTGGVYYTCAAYSNSSTCTFSVSLSQPVYITIYSTSCTGDQYIYLYDAYYGYYNYDATNDDQCSNSSNSTCLCSKINRYYLNPYYYPRSYSSLTMYLLEGLYCALLLLFDL